MGGTDPLCRAVRLAHQTFLALLLAVLITIVAMAGLFAFNLERGFVAYVNARQAEQLDTLERLLVQEIRRGASVEAIAGDPRLWRRLLARSAAPVEAEAAAVPEGLPPRLRERLPPGAPGAAEPRFPERSFRPALPAAPALADRRGPLPPPADPLGLTARVELLDVGHRPLPGPRPPPPNADSPVERALAVDGRTVGWIRVWPLRRVDRPEDVAFLQSQYGRIGWTAGALILLTALVAPLVARRVTRPLSAIARATERIARGELAVRLPADRGDEIGALMRNVSAMAQSLQRLEQSRRQWIAEISHELRTPLTVLNAELEALADGVRALDAAAIGSLREETARLARLVDDLHQLALADLGALPCTMAPADLGAIVERAAARCRDVVARKGLRLAVAVPRQPVVLQADAQRLDQLVTNLLDNSIRYTDAPGSIAVRLATQGRHATLVVEDSAPGVADGEIERLFEPLYRADAARRRSHGGSGLGLAIARAIVAAHHGEIRAAASTQGGLAITVTFALSP